METSKVKKWLPDAFELAVAVDSSLKESCAWLKYAFEYRARNGSSNGSENCSPKAKTSQMEDVLEFSARNSRPEGLSLLQPSIEYGDL